MDPITPGTRFVATGYKAEGFYNSALQSLVSTEKTISYPFQPTSDSRGISPFPSMRDSWNTVGADDHRKSTMSIELTEDNRMRLAVNDSSVQTPKSYSGDDRWHHWVFAYDESSGELNIYLDGNEVASHTGNISEGYFDQNESSVGASINGTILSRRSRRVSGVVRIQRKFGRKRNKRIPANDAKSV